MMPTIHDLRDHGLAGSDIRNGSSMKLTRLFFHFFLMISFWLSALFAIGCGGRGNHAETSSSSHIHWSYTPGPDALSGVALAPNGTVHFAGSDGIYALSPEGKLLWKAPLPSGAVIAAPALAPNGTLYAASKAGNLFALDPSGNLVWQSTNSGRKFFTPPALGN